MNTYFLSGSAVTAVICFIHCWFGGKFVAEPLLKARDLHEVPKYTNYYCWHMVSIMLAVMSGAYLWAGLRADAMELGVLAFALSVAFCVWSLVLVTWKKQSFRELPQWSLFAVAAALGGLGLAL
ncbi:hypothetical protein [Kordiimonas gwangyangensis]|uniref:hypothetical protein n=1 Tax=Kordiimonas gwangyangensis TaxID=288022 RepID=UPI00037D0450|nr:hypothetical protein [Kordiimonas gwangyangensis]